MPVGKSDKLEGSSCYSVTLGVPGNVTELVKAVLEEKRLPRKLWPGNTVSFNYSNDLLGVHK